MAQTIKLKNSGTSGNTPSSLVHGELALNYADGKLFYKNSSNSIVELSTAGSFLPLSGGTLTGTLLGTNAAFTGKVAVANSGVHPSYHFYNNLNSYFNGSVEINDSLSITGSNAALSVSGAITADTGGASQNVLNIGGSSATNYTIQRWLTSAHSGNEAYILAYGASHSSEAGNFAIKNLEANSDIFFELAGSVEPLRLTSTGAAFPDGSTSAPAIRFASDSDTGLIRSGSPSGLGLVSFTPGSLAMFAVCTSSHAL